MILVLQWGAVGALLAGLAWGAHHLGQATSARTEQRQLARRVRRRAGILLAVLVIALAALAGYGLAVLVALPSPERAAIGAATLGLLAALGLAGNLDRLS